jgi:hypothetical protein
MATKGDISDLDVLQFGGEPIVPQVGQSSFDRRRNSGVVTSDVAGGASRQRKKYFNTTHMAEVGFYLETAQMQDYMELFVRNNEGKKFICYLAADRPLVEPYVVQFIGDVNYGDVDAKDSLATATLEIFPARDQVLDDYLYSLYPVVGNDLAGYLSGFKQIVMSMPNE